MQKCSSATLLVLGGKVTCLLPLISDVPNARGEPLFYNQFLGASCTPWRDELTRWRYTERDHRLLLVQN